jgi:hypothetical protein
MLAIGAMVLAFANPVWVSEGNSVAGGNSSVVILIDNSLSMTAADENGQYIQQARLLARDIVQSYNAADEFQLQTISRLRLSSPFSSRTVALEAIETIETEEKAVGIGKLIEELPQLFTRANYARKAVYFISDFQKSTVLGDSVKQLTAALKTYDIRFIPIGGRAQPNVYLTGVTLENQLVEKGKPIKIKITLNNDSPESVKNLSIKVQSNKKAVAIASENLEPNQSKEAILTFLPEKSGWQGGVIQIDDPQIEFDNRRYFSFYVPEKAKLLVIEGENTDGGSNQYLRLVFQQLMTQFETTIISEKAASTANISDYQVIVLAGLQDISSGFAERLSLWVREAGGGLLFFPAENQHMAAVNSFYQRLGIGQFGALKTFKPAIMMLKPELEHLLFQGVFINTEKTGTFDAPLLSQYFSFTPAASGYQQTILRGAGGDVILQEAKSGNGTVLTFSISAETKFSDFPIKTIFVPVIYRSILLLSNTAKNEQEQVLGNFQPKRIKTARKEPVVLKSEQNNAAFIPEQYAQDGFITLRFDRLGLVPGNYSIVQADTVLGAISFNLPDAESRMGVAGEAELQTWLKNNGLNDIEIMNPRTGKLFRDMLQMQRAGIALWKYFLLAALLLLAAEIVLIKYIRR